MITHRLCRLHPVRRHDHESEPPDGGSSVSLFRPKRHKNVGQRLAGLAGLADLAEEFGPNAAKGTCDFTADASFRGVADVKESRETVTEYLSPGTYDLADLGAPPPARRT